MNPQVDAYIRASFAAPRFDPIAPARAAARYVDDAYEATERLGLREADANRGHAPAPDLADRRVKRCVIGCNVPSCAQSSPPSASAPSVVHWRGFSLPGTGGAFSVGRPHSSTSGQTRFSGRPALGASLGWS